MTKICNTCLKELPITQFYKECAKCKDCRQMQNRAWKAANKDKITANAKKYYLENKERILTTSRKWSDKNRARISKNSAEWYMKNKEKKREYRQTHKDQYNAWYVAYKKLNLQFKIACTLRSRFHGVLKGKIKAGLMVEVLGCTIVELKTYLESKFQPGMTWDNHGEWHIDHIRPLASFDLTDFSQQKIAFNFKNLQPLWAADNLRKGAKIS